MPPSFLLAQKGVDPGENKTVGFLFMKLKLRKVFAKVLVVLGASTFAGAPALADEQPTMPAEQFNGQAVTTASEQGEGSGAVTTQSAQPAALEQIKSKFEAAFDGIEVDEVRPTPFAELYEVRLGTELLYTNEALDFVLQGALVDVSTLTDLTAQRVEELNRVDFAQLPLDAAIKQVKGDGSRQLVVFEDPNCVYCKRLHETFAELDDLTVYSLMFPILAPDSRTIAEHVWCADDAPQVWSDWMLNEDRPAEVTCENPIDELLQTGLDLGVQGTPAIFFEDGSRVNGWLPADKLEAKLQSVTEKLENATDAPAASDADGETNEADAGGLDQ